MEINSEIALIGSILLDQSKMVEVVNTVDVNDFFNDNAREAFIIAKTLWMSKKKVDLVSVAAESMKLSSFLASTTTSADPIGILDYAKQVSKIAKAKRIDVAAENIKVESDPSKKLGIMFDVYQRENFVDTKDPSISSVVDRFIEYQNSNEQGVSTGFEFLDKNYIEMCPGHLWIMGAFTSVGKTAMSLQFICNMIKSGNCPRIVLISTEMTEVQVVARIIANLTGIYAKKIEKKNLRPIEYDAVGKWVKYIKTLPITIYDDINELSAIESAFMKADLQGGVDIGVVDYVQNCCVDGINDIYNEQKTIATRFQKLAKDTKMCLFCLSQLSNSAAKDDDLLEFKGAGEWSSAPDVAIRLMSAKDEPGRILFSLKKNRHGKKDLNYFFDYVNDYSRLECAGEMRTF